MLQNPYDSYIESQVLSASPVELVQMLYRAAIDATEAARRHLRNGDIAARTTAATRAYNLVAELTQSLDMESGGRLAESLRELYDYILRRIHEGNYQQLDAPFEEAVRLLNVLLEGWSAISAGPEIPTSGQPVSLQLSA